MTLLPMPPDTSIEAQRRRDDFRQRLAAQRWSRRIDLLHRRAAIRAGEVVPDAPPRPHALSVIDAAIRVLVDEGLLILMPARASQFLWFWLNDAPVGQGWLMYRASSGTHVLQPWALRWPGWDEELPPRAGTLDERQGVLTVADREASCAWLADHARMMRETSDPREVLPREAFETISGLGFDAPA